MSDVWGRAETLYREVQPSLNMSGGGAGPGPFVGTHPILPCEQNEWQTRLKTLPSRNLVGGR